jgi:hypothetical protein
MKKLLTNFCALFLVCLAASHVNGQISLGAKTGVNLNQFRQPGTTMGVNFGIYGSYQINPFVTVKLEPHYSLEGGGRPDYYRYYADISDNVYSISFINPSVRFHNLQIPLLVEVTLPELTDQTVVPVLIVGASYAAVMSSLEQHTKRYGFINQDIYPPSSYYDDPQIDVSYQQENVIDNYSRNQWSLWLGMGMKVKTGDRTFGFDVRYRHGLNNLNRLRFTSPGNGGDIGTPGTGGNLFSSSLSLNFSMSIFNF